jgi:hypothetical protein
VSLDVIYILITTQKNIVRKNTPKGKVKVIPDVEESEDTSNR